WRAGAPQIGTRVALDRRATNSPHFRTEQPVVAQGGSGRDHASQLANMSGRDFIDELLAEQQGSSAVERFSRRHEKHDVPAQSLYYRDLIPLTAPKSGEQYAFEVELDKCSGCK